MKNKLLMVIVTVVIASALAGCGTIATVDGKVVNVTWDTNVKPYAQYACNKAARLSVKDTAFELAAENECIDKLKDYYDSHSEFGVYWPGPGNPNLDSSPASETAYVIVGIWEGNNWITFGAFARDNLMTSFKEARLAFEESLKTIH